ncbi:MAG: NADPH quinone reductase MdaB, partial [Duodenibacillus sp.]|nr:NADPH quinone reductase MdaB [Duodenibacillus sp.]
MTKAKNILIIDAGCQNYGKGGTLNHHFAAVAKEVLEGLGHAVAVTRCDCDFDPDAEAAKVAAADAVIVQ